MTTNTFSPFKYPDRDLLRCCSWDWPRWDAQEGLESVVFIACRSVSPLVKSCPDIADIDILDEPPAPQSDTLQDANFPMLMDRSIKWYSHSVPSFSFRKTSPRLGFCYLDDCHLLSLANPNHSHGKDNIPTLQCLVPSAGGTLPLFLCFAVCYPDFIDLSSKRTAGPPYSS